MIQKWGPALVGISLIATLASAQTREQRLEAALKKYPEADTNHDGTLTQKDNIKRLREFIRDQFRKRMRIYRYHGKICIEEDAGSGVTMSSRTVSSLSKGLIGSKDDRKQNMIAEMREKWEKAFLI